jgi:hypothetical protein
MNSAVKFYGNMAQYGTIGGLLVFCLKTKSVKTKLFLGWLYTYWIKHFYTLVR